MTVSDTRYASRHEGDLRRDDDRLRVPRLRPLEIAALAVAAIMALGPLAAYAVGLGP